MTGRDVCEEAPEGPDLEERRRDKWSFYFRVIRHNNKKRVWSPGIFARQGHFIIGRKVRGEHFSGKEEVNSAWRCDRSGKGVCPHRKEVVVVVVLIWKKEGNHEEEHRTGHQHDWLETRTNKPAMT